MEKSFAVDKGLDTSDLFLMFQACITKCKSHLTRNATVTESEHQNRSLQSISSKITTIFGVNTKEVPPPSYDQALEYIVENNLELPIFPPNVNHEGRRIENVLFPPPAYETVVKCDL